ncbi:hypothetical protein GJ744_004959 [Endocarpon pusillum]|uniref:BZIP domain-containing protein n=1 Tax=Endocarpon pusillum TaxID=364733 RepID=A0A8H7A591_9EURO|nr:hypothetical protein GJ744_004959 [Endocarpon pusillum]
MGLDTERASRLRENKRRSRARQKEYTADLEQKLRQLQRDGVQATIEIQLSARKVFQENKNLRGLLQHLGVDENTINSWAEKNAEDNCEGLNGSLRRHCLRGPAGAGYGQANTNVENQRREGHQLWEAATSCDPSSETTPLTAQRVVAGAKGELGAAQLEVKRWEVFLKVSKPSKVKSFRRHKSQPLDSGLLPTTTAQQQPVGTPNPPRRSTRLQQLKNRQTGQVPEMGALHPVHSARVTKVQATSHTTKGNAGPGRLSAQNSCLISKPHSPHSQTSPATSVEPDLASLSPKPLLWGQRPLQATEQLKCHTVFQSDAKFHEKWMGRRSARLALKHAQVRVFPPDHELITTSELGIQPMKASRGSKENGIFLILARMREFQGPLESSGLHGSSGLSFTTSEISLNDDISQQDSQDQDADGFMVLSLPDNSHSLPPLGRSGPSNDTEAASDRKCYTA